MPVFKRQYIYISNESPHLCEYFGYHCKIYMDIFWKSNGNICNRCEFLTTASTIILAGIKTLNCQLWQTPFISIH